ncbi:MAG: ankyrin repeat domain-containing protein [Spirochaetota bacterium]
MNNFRIYLYIFLIFVFVIIVGGCKQQITKEEIGYFKKAIENNKKDYIHKIIEKGLDINDFKSLGYIPLHEAVKTNNIELIELFLNNGADINAINECKQNCLFLTININTMKFLISKGANINQVDNFGNIPLAYCLWSYDLSKMYIDNGANINNVNKEGYPLLFMALLEGENNVIVYLINNSKLKIQVCNKKGENAIIWYSYCGYDCYILDKLLMKGLELNSISKNGVNALIASVIVSYRFKEKNINKNYRYITHLIHKGININHQDKLGNTALHYAVIRERPIELLSLLLKYGARKDIRNNEGKTPLDIAIEKKR